MQNNKTFFISLIADLNNKKGHVYKYNLIFNKLLKNTKIKYYVYFWNKFQIKVPKNWFQHINGEYLSINLRDFKSFNPFKIFYGLIVFVSSIKKIFRLFPDPNRKIFFVERFNLFQFFGFCISFLFCSNKNIEVWFLFRNLDTFRSIRNVYYQFLIRFLFNIKYKIFVDTLDLKLIADKLFNFPSILLPIPHISKTKTNFAIRKKDKYLLYWPGNPRPEKGLKMIQKLLVDNNYNNFEFILPNIKELSDIKSKFKIKFIIEHLSDKDYYDFINDADFVLLPYTSKIYQNSSSGIFVEVIVAKKIPLVQVNTWMAKELTRFCLHDLIIDFSKFNINSIDKIIQNKSLILKKLKLMSLTYSKFHNYDSFKKIILEQLN